MTTVLTILLMNAILASCALHSKHNQKLHDMKDPADKIEKESKTAPEKYKLPPVDPLKLYQKWFRVRRAEHLAAVKEILKSDNNRQNGLVKAMLDAMKNTLSDKRKQLVTSSFIPGESEFPEKDEKLKDNLSTVLENSALFLDMALRLPDITAAYLKRNDQFDELIKWAVGFSEATKFMDEITMVALDLAKQELNWIERTSEFQNPYRIEYNKQELKEKKKERKPVKKGPKIGGRKQEL